MSVQDVCRDRKLSEQTFYPWKREFEILEVNQAKQLKELLKEALEKSCEPQPHARSSKTYGW